jgi:hypothetical protein
MMAVPPPNFGGRSSPLRTTTCLQIAVDYVCAELVMFIILLNRTLNGSVETVAIKVCEILVLIRMQSYKINSARHTESTCSSAWEQVLR